MATAQGVPAGQLSDEAVTRELERLHDPKPPLPPNAKTTL